MPKGNPKPQTVATRKYEEKIGMISKSYKLRKELVDEFAEATKAQGSNQSKELSRMMQEYINKWKDSAQ
jgi:predicted DNA-binding protein YlxM (UPF0122 family)